MQALKERWPPGAAATAALLVLASLFLAGVASGHTRLAASEPADGAVLEQAPVVVALTFSEPVRPASLRLVDAADPREPAVLDARVDGMRVMAALPADLLPGAYALEFRVLAADGHAVRGTITFRLLADASAPLYDEETQPSSPERVASMPPAGEVRTGPASVTAYTDHSTGYRWLAWGVRAAFLILLLLAAGQALFCALLPVPEPLAATLRHSLALLALGGLVLAPVHLQTTGLYALGTAGLLDPEAWRLAASSSVGLSVGLAVPGFVLLALAGRNPQVGLLIVGAVLLLFSRTQTGHPVSRDPGWLLMPAMLLHAGCAAWWYGSLWPLRRLLTKQAPEVAAHLVTPFSVLTLAAVTLLVFAGLMMALVHLAAPAALVTTDYGRLLLGKLALFLLLLALAAWHKLALTPGLARADIRAAEMLRTGIAVEAAVMTLLLLVSIGLTGSAPELPDGGFWR